jgi:hypothetical protein
LNEAFIGVAARAAKLMVEVGYGQFPLQHRRKAVQHVKQNHRVTAAGNRHEDALAAAEEASRTDGFFNSTQQISHRMIGWSLDGSSSSSLPVSARRAKMPAKDI